MLLLVRPLAIDLGTALMLLTRLPVGRMAAAEKTPQAGRPVWAYPVVGIIVGAIGAALNGLARAIGVPETLAAIWTVAGLVLVTGGLHEDGLADTADGFGGGATRERRLAIMRDSCIGVYGVLGVALSLGLRCAGIATLHGAAVAAALIAAGTCGRASMIGVLLMAGPARKDGLAVALGRPHRLACWAGILAASVVTLAVLPLPAAALAITMSVTAALVVAALAERRIGGYTGDVLGAVEQVVECLVLTVAATA
jgi:adenosylcobinamide-GDP ribazoletransferase